MCAAPRTGTYGSTELSEEKREEREELEPRAGTVTLPFWVVPRARVTLC